MQTDRLQIDQALTAPMAVFLLTQEIPRW